MNSKHANDVTVPQRYLDVLQELYARLKGSDVNWALTGSVSFALQGVLVEVHDIDVQTDAAGAYEIERRFSDCLVESVSYPSDDRIRSHFGALIIDGIRVEICGAIQKRLPDGTWEDPVDPARHKCSVQVEGTSLPVLALEYECVAYRILGRMEEAELLRKCLARRDQEA